MTEIVKRCPLCGGGLVVRTNRENGSEFLGCTGYPSDCCTRTTVRRFYVRQRAAGWRRNGLTGKWLPAQEVA